MVTFHVNAQITLAISHRWQPLFRPYPVLATWPQCDSSLFLQFPLRSGGPPASAALSHSAPRALALLETGGPAVPLREFPQETRKHTSNKSLYLNVHSDIVHNTAVRTRKQSKCVLVMDTQNAVHAVIGILCSHEKAASTDACLRTDEPWKHDAMWNEWVAKGSKFMIPFILNALKR